MKKYTIFVCLIAVCACSRLPLPQTSSIGAAQSMAEYSEIIHANTWIAGARYGYSGEKVNKSAVALRKLTKDPNAEQKLLEILESATPAGKLYALCGLYRVNQRTFWTRVTPFLTNSNTVIGVFADVEVDVRICDVVFAPCEICGKSPNEIMGDDHSLAMCLSKHKRKGNDYLILDIAGGGYPSKLIDGW